MGNLSFYLKPLFLIVAVNLISIETVTAQPAAAPVSMQCIDSRGHVHGADPKEVCTAILPKCETAKEDLIKSVLEMLSMKEYTLYLGMDADISQGKNSVKTLITPTSATASPSPAGLITLTKADFVGTEMTQAICNVMGQGPLKLPSGTKNIPGAEIANHTGIGDPAHALCGELPLFYKKDSGNGRDVDFQLGSTTGNSRIASYLLGARIFTIKKKAKEILSKLDLQNLDPNNTLPSVASGIASSYTALNKIVSNLGGDEKAECSKAPSDLDCLKMDSSSPHAVQRVCGLKTVQTLVNRASMSSIVYFQIIKESEDDYKKYFSNFMSPDSSFDRFLGSCTRTVKKADLGKLNFTWLIPFVGPMLAQIFIDMSGGIEGWTTNNELMFSAVASCMLSENTPGGDHYCLESNDAHSLVKKGNCGSNSAKASSRFKINPGSNKMVMFAEGTPEGASSGTFYSINFPITVTTNSSNQVSSAGVSPRDFDEYTVNRGLAGAFEQGIRSYCGQTKFTDVDKYCATDPKEPFYFPHVPKGVKP